MKISRDIWPVISDKHRQTVSPQTITPRPAPRAPRPAEKGIALVITLIMLSVTLVMAVAFLALSQRERKSVSTTTDTTTARLAADSALNAAQAQVISTMLANNSANYNFGLLVSTNYQNNFGFVPGAVSPTNVNYDYTSDGSGYNSDDMVQNIANLQFLPRVPVFIDNDFRFYLDLNRNGKFEPTGPDVPNIDYLGVTNGTVPGIGDPQWIGVLERPDAPHGPNNKFVARIAFFGMPVGNGLDINYVNNAAQLPSQSAFDSLGKSFLRNQGVGSWEINLGAFFTDLNTNDYAWNAVGYNYNPANTSLTKGNGFQDAASIYAYRLSGNPLTYTYNTANLPSINNVFGFNAGNIFGFDLVDQYSDGPLQLTTVLPSDNDQANANYPWPGAPSTNQFSDLTADLYNVNKTGVNFTNHLLNANSGFNSVNPATYDRYTLYRLLSQLGTDSEPDTTKMNLNYSNVFIGYNLVTGVPTNIMMVPNAETNLISWRPLDFFTAAANRLLLNYSANWFADSPSNYLQTYYGLIGNNANYYHYSPSGIFLTNDATGFGLTNFGLILPAPGFNNNTILRLTNQVPVFGVTNIPVYVNGQFVYTPAINRALQLAANMYDASTNKTFLLGKDFPSVFRPIFERDDLRNVFIVGYQQIPDVIGTNDVVFSRPYDIESLTNYISSYTPMVDGSGNYINVYNVPWIIGARKGFPNFNNFAEENIFSINRRLRLTRMTNSATVNITVTNQLYMMGASASMGLNFWNSYVSNYNGTVLGQAYVSLAMAVTNDVGLRQQLPFFETNAGVSVLNWPGSGTALNASGSPNPASIKLAFWSPQFLTNVVYRTAAAPATPGTLGSYSGSLPVFFDTNLFTLFGVTQVFETNNQTLSIPHFGETATNHVQVFLVSPNISGRYQVIDYVQIGEHYTRDLNAEIFTDNTLGGVWNTNNGILNQLMISRGLSPYTTPTTQDGQWNADPQAATLGGTVQQQQTYFNQFFYPFGLPGFLNGRSIINVLDQIQAPYSPTRYVVHYTSWEANDPLVHYMAADLHNVVTNTPSFNGPTTIPSITNLDLTGLNKNYNPWGGNPYEYNSGHTTTISGTDTNRFSYWLKDPGASSSDTWDFPTNKYPSIGWVGRVHRGSPWQTVYLKSSDILNDFVNGPLTWAQWSGNPNVFDGDNTAPAWDRQLFDLFTSAVNEDATRGDLSVNVGANNGGGSLAAWSAVLSGVVVLTNVAPNPQATGASNSWLVIQPAGVAGTTTNSPLGVIVNSINNTRANTNLFPRSVFTHIGDVLRAPALTQVSPYLNLSSSEQLQYGISDETYEWIPQQVMGLLRMNSAPRYVVYGYGQTLRPAPNGLVMSAGDNFGLVTNYQVVAESAVRAVIAVQAHTNIVTTSLGAGFETNYTTQVENYNVLAPQ